MVDLIPQPPREKGIAMPFAGPWSTLRLRAKETRSGFSARPQPICITSQANGTVMPGAGNSTQGNFD